MSLRVRVASVADVGAIATLVNAAFRVEDFFKIGDRTNEDEIRAHLQTGVFLVLQDDKAPEGAAPPGCAYLKVEGALAYFGMLSIDPARQGTGLGRFMIETLEDRGRSAGCAHMEIHVVNLREDLLPMYRRLGYVETGVLPFPDDGSSSRLCHFVVMTKRLF